MPQREEKSFINKFSFIPFAIGILLLVIMFSSFNPDLADARKVIMKKGGITYLQKKIKRNWLTPTFSSPTINNKKSRSDY